MRDPGNDVVPDRVFLQQNFKLIDDCCASKSLRRSVDGKHSMRYVSRVKPPFSKFLQRTGLDHAVPHFGPAQTRNLDWYSSF